MGHYSKQEEEKLFQEINVKQWYEPTFSSPRLELTEEDAVQFDQEWDEFMAGNYHPVDKPVGYNSHPSKVECIEITEHMNFCRGNALKYLWRAGIKDKNTEIEDLEKAIYYINREIARLEKLL